MSLRTLIRRWLVQEPEPVPPARHARREAARERHADGGPGWSVEDRVDEGAVSEVADIAPGLPGSGASHRVVSRD